MGRTRTDDLTDPRFATLRRSPVVAGEALWLVIGQRSLGGGDPRYVVIRRKRWAKRGVIIGCW